MKRNFKKLIITALLSLLLIFGCSQLMGTTHVEAKGKTNTTATKQKKDKKVKSNKPAAYELTAEERAYYSALIRNIYQDEVTATIVDLGFIQKVNQIKASADGNFVVDFKAITGDTDNPMLIFDLYVTDQNIIAMHPQLEANVYTLGVNVFQNELEHYGYCDAICHQDPVNTNIYHGVMRGAPAWLCSDEEAVVYFKQIRVGYSVLPVETEFRVKPVSAKYLPAPSQYVDRTFSYEGITLNLSYVEFSLYGTRVSFNFDFLGQPWANGATDFEQVRSVFEDRWNRLKASSYFLVDGVPVMINQNLHEYAYSDDDTKKCYTHMNFYGINFPYAKEVKLVCGDQIIKIK